MISLCYLENSSIPIDLSLLIQIFIFFAKSHHHKTKWAQTKPNGLYFENQRQQYVSTIKHLGNNKAAKTIRAYLQYFTSEEQCFFSLVLSLFVCFCHFVISWILKKNAAGLFILSAIFCLYML